ncbi:MAG: PH domain-containing protein [Armatimonadetes bacterium]|nr:PH domain-containing protein [Armatimonadota bacterium]
MASFIDNLTPEARERINQLLSPAEEPNLAFFCGGWTPEGEVPTIETFLREYDVLLSTQKRILHLKKGWVQLQGQVVEIPFESITGAELEKYLQSSNVRIKLGDKTYKIEKCQHLHAERLFRYVEQVRTKSAEATRTPIAYPLDKGVPTQFIISYDDKNQEILSVMFVAKPKSPALPPPVTILSYDRKGACIHEYYLEPAR